MNGLEKDNNQNTKVILAALFGYSFWGFSFFASRVALNSANMFVLLSHRFLTAFLVMTILIVLGFSKIEIKGKRIRFLIYLGIAEPVVYFLGEQYGILHSNTIFSGVMIAMIPIVSTIAAAIILKEKPTRRQFLFGVLSVGGVIGIGLMSSSSGVIEFSGVIALIIAVLSAVAYTLIGRKISDEFTPFERTYAMIAIGAVVFTVMAFVYLKGDIQEYISPISNLSYTTSILFLALFCSVGSYFLTSYAITYISVARQTVFANLTTAVSVFAGAIFLHEPFTAIGLLFCLMILVGIYGVQKG